MDENTTQTPDAPKSNNLQRYLLIGLGAVAGIIVADYAYGKIQARKEAQLLSLEAFPEE